ncbi:hypothetical protein FHX75_1596 [Micromonospora palomenae]|uniref:Bacterial CdiA-CT RNAse A domain-containing protein n=1 Tax=Micromonospora palomenae TaxID=1461247 RepID=A0A561VHB6_9ACTN|nr:hypothetical protein [Micromonospora palomenae]TWG11008.1 hypothetical protein FHX75_1596 [Micromonospora palomenae]
MRDRNQDRPVFRERSWEADRARYESRARSMRADELRNGGHTFREHVDVGPADTERRVRTGINARGVASLRIPEHATRWTSDRAVARAAEQVWRSPEAQRAVAEQNRARPHGGSPTTMGFTARISLPEALGPNWRSMVAGHSRSPDGIRTARFTDRSEAVAVWRMNDEGKWYLRTCYPYP